MMSVNLIYSLVLLLLPLLSFSQSPHFRAHSLPSDNKNIAVHTLLQDQNSFIWLGTSNGLYRFDGSSFKPLIRTDSSLEQTITALYEDSKHILWIGYRSGRIEKLVEGSFRPFAAHNLPTTPITDFVEDKNGLIWVSSYGSGLYVVNDNSLTQISQREGLSDDFVYTLAADNDGNVWAGTDRGISICQSNGQQKNVKRLTSTDGLPDNIVTFLSRDGDNGIWIGTESAGICRYDLATQKIQPYSRHWQFGRVTSILPFNDALWIGTTSHGIIESDLSGSRVFDINSSNKNIPARITSLTTDKEGNIWVTEGGRNIYSTNRTFAFLSNFRDQAISNIQALIHLRNNNLLFSTSDGLYTISHGSSGAGLKKFAIPELAGIQIISLYEDKDGFVWMGTFDQGVFRLEPRTMKLYQVTEQDGLINNNVLSIAGIDDELWFATLGGVSQCRIPPVEVPKKEPPSKKKPARKKNAKPQKPKLPLTFTNYTSQSGLGSNYIYKIFVDSKKRIWFATDGKGIAVRENNSFRNYSLKEGLSSNIIYSVTEDSHGDIWLSTSNAGIYKLSGSSFEPFASNKMLRDPAISSIIGDKQGNIIVVSNEGIDIVDPRSNAVFYHGVEFGIHDIDPNLNTYATDTAGNIWIGTQQGIIKYNTNIPQMPKWPLTRINEVQIFLNAVADTTREFNHDNNHISFDYIGFWYHDPAEVSYQIRLEGYDREWINSKNHFITYPSLAPGSYTFMVRSSVTGQFEGAPVEKFSFVINPPFYNTPWFYSLAGVALVALVLLVVSRRERRLKARERQEKQKIQFQLETLKNQINPHFLFNSFNTLIGVIEEDKKTAVEYVEKLSDFYREILLNRELDVIPLSKEIDLIRNYYFLQVKRYKSNFKLNIDVPDGALGKLIPPLTLQLLVENALKHNIILKERPLIIEIFVEDNYLGVKNNLQKKVSHERSTGMGLNNIMKRFQLLSQNNVRVHETDEFFVVFVPLINS